MYRTSVVNSVTHLHVSVVVSENKFILTKCFGRGETGRVSIVALFIEVDSLNDRTNERSSGIGIATNNRQRRRRWRLTSGDCLTGPCVELIRGRCGPDLGRPVVSNCEIGAAVGDNYAERGINSIVLSVLDSTQYRPGLLYWRLDVIVFYSVGLEGTV